MKNISIIKMLNQIADILELQEENQFRIRSYRKAAQSIENLSEDLSGIKEKFELEKIPGIGKSISDKIKEFLKTGKCKYHQQLMEKPEAKLIEVMNIPGLGPKKVKQIYKILKINSIEEFERAAKNYKMQNLEGIGAKSEKKILKSIQLFKKARGKFKLSESLSYAESIMDKLKKESKKIICAGSIRRRKETVKDIDMLIIPKTNSMKTKIKIMNKFTSFDEVSDILNKGKTKSSIILKNGLQVDLRIIESSSYGAALVYFTGSKQHNILIREIAKKKNLKINEYGVFSIKGKKIAGKTEKEVYNCIELPFIQPELREGSNEIEIAQKNKLPRLIDFSDYRGDLHIHTKYTDGINSIEEIAQIAKNKNYEYIAITDHSQAVHITGGLKPNELIKQTEQIKKINKKFQDFTILSGIEVDILKNGQLDMPDKILEKCDIVIAAIHSGFNMEKQDMTKRIIKALENKNVNILAHPTGRIINKRNPYQVDINKIIESAKKNNVILELNSYPDRLDLNANHCKVCKENGIKISINTDSHNLRHLDNIKYGIYTARRGWLEAKDVINTYPLSKLRKILNKN